MAAMQTTLPGAKLDDLQVIALASELNHLLWTDEPPEMTPDIARVMRDDPTMELSRLNMHCQAHSAVCAGLMLRRGDTVTTRGGSALIVFPEQRQFDKPHFVMKHWWISTSAGLCDLSLNLTEFSKHKAIIFGNKNVADPNWRVAFKDDFKRTFEDAAKSHASGTCGVFYQTDAKLSVTREEFEPEWVKVFSAAKKRGIPLRFIDIIEHSERLLKGGESLRHLPQQEAWKHLARG